MVGSGSVLLCRRMQRSCLCDGLCDSCSRGRCRRGRIEHWWRRWQRAARAALLVPKRLLRWRWLLSNSCGSSLLRPDLLYEVIDRYCLLACLFSLRAGLRRACSVPCAGLCTTLSCGNVLRLLDRRGVLIVLISRLRCHGWQHNRGSQHGAVIVQLRAADCHSSACGGSVNRSTASRCDASSATACSNCRTVRPLW